MKVAWSSFETESNAAGVSDTADRALVAVPMPTASL